MGQTGGSSDKRHDQSEVAHRAIPGAGLAEERGLAVELAGHDLQPLLASGANGRSGQHGCVCLGQRVAVGEAAADQRARQPNQDGDQHHELNCLVPGSASHPADDNEQCRQHGRGNDAGAVWIEAGERGVAEQLPRQPAADRLRYEVRQNDQLDHEHGHQPDGFRVEAP